MRGKELLTFEAIGLSLMREISQVAKNLFYNAPAREVKGDGSFVSEADRQLELLAREFVAKETPNLGFAGEEFGRIKKLSNNQVSLEKILKKQSLKTATEDGGEGLLDFEQDLNEPIEELLNLNEDTYWLFDPIDGTINFLARSPLWTQLLALIVKGEPVLGIVSLPMIDEIFVASKDNGAWFGPLFGNKADFRKCHTSKTKHLNEAHLSVSSPQYFSRRGIESWYQSLLARPGDLRTHSDAYGYTRILCGGIDAQIDPMAFPHDIAALQVLFDETPDATFTTLQGHSGPSRFQRGSMLAAATPELATELLNNYHEHLRNNLPKATEHVSPQDFTQRFLLDHVQMPFADRPNETRVWARAMETAVAMFRQVNPDHFVEDVSCIAAATDSVSVRVKNGVVEAPPRRRDSVGIAIRAVVGGGTGQVVSALPESESKVSLVYKALELAKEQSTLGKCDSESDVLSYRDHVHGHVGPMPWGQRIDLSLFHSIVESISENQKNARIEKIHTLETSLNLSTEHRVQIFLDGSQHTVSLNTTQFGNVATSVEGNEKRRAFARTLENKALTLSELSTLHKKNLETTTHHAVDMLKAEYVPENIEYDYLAVGADLMGLILHEAVGHAAEGDLIATGQSGFGKDGQLMNMQVGPEWLHIAIDGSLNNCGISFIDVEGTVARRKWLVKNGYLVDAIHTRETSRRAKSVPDGSARIESIFHPAINRMTSIWVQSDTLLPLAKNNDDSDLAAISPDTLYKTLVESKYLKPGTRILYLSGWKGGTASCANLEFRADVERIYMLEHNKKPKLMREANFTGIATECFKSAVASFGPVLCRTIGMCGKDGQQVPTSDGAPAVMLLKATPMVRVIGSGEAAE